MPFLLHATLWSVPTPLGHALAGLTIAWTSEAARRVSISPRTRTALIVAGAGFAIAPDLDLVYPPIHRMMSHSITALILATACAAIVAHRTNQDRPWLLTAVCGLAYASHLALDFVGGDTKEPAGMLLLWPFSDSWFSSSSPVFMPAVLRGFLKPRVLLWNTLSVLRELAILSPFAVGAWFLKIRLERSRNGAASTAPAP